MHRIASFLTVGFILALTGCPSDDSPPPAGSGDSTAGDPTTTSTTDPMMTTMSMTTMVDPDTTAGMTTEVDPTGVDPTGVDPTGVDPTGVDPTGMDPTGGNMDVCAPEPGGDVCQECVKAMCCDQLEACVADIDNPRPGQGCNCFQECVANGGAPVGDCDGQCNVNVFNPGSPTGALGACTLQSCSMECPIG